MTKRFRPTLNLIGPDGQRHPVRPLTRSRHRTIFRPYSTEIGHLATSWNQLHHNLSSIFTVILSAKHYKYAEAIWYSTDSDFAQRKMLRSLIQVDQGLLPYKRYLKPQQAEAILWILNQIDQKLRHDRNNAMHAPLVILTSIRDGGIHNSVEAHFSALNPRTKSLRGKDLLQEFREYAAHARMLARYSYEVWAGLGAPFWRASWPKKPKLPQAHRKKRSTRPGRGQPRPRPHGAS